MNATQLKGKVNYAVKQIPILPGILFCLLFWFIALVSADVWQRWHYFRHKTYDVRTDVALEYTRLTLIKTIPMVSAIAWTLGAVWVAYNAIR